ncbi:MAG: GCN5-related N-acetyltransferase, partial [Clostridia bacterium]|nr:GCN5-related N-acetyltransferase [Clostridia bacterium]
MKRWYTEEYSFKITVLAVKPDNRPERHCRNGHEVGDEFFCEYGCPSGFCSKSMFKLFPLMEAVRSGGDLRKLGGIERSIMEFGCPDGVVRFRLEGFINNISELEMQTISPQDRTRVTEFIKEHWYSTDMLIRGKIIDMTKVDGFVIFDDSNTEIVGLITYIIEDDECEITSFDSTIPNRGIGTRLLNKLINTAKDLSCSKIKLITTNDNIKAIRFYQKHGFDLFCINRGAIDRERILKPEIPYIGENGIPIKH